MQQKSWKINQGKYQKGRKIEEKKSQKTNRGYLNKRSYKKLDRTKGGKN